MSGFQFVAVLVDDNVWMSLLVVQFIEDGIYSVWMETTISAQPILS